MTDIDAECLGPSRLISTFDVENFFNVGQRWNMARTLQVSWVQQHWKTEWNWTDPHEHWDRLDRSGIRLIFHRKRHPSCIHLAGLIVKAVWLFTAYLRTCFTFDLRRVTRDDVLGKMKTRIPSLRPAMRGGLTACVAADRISILKCASFLHAAGHADPIVKLAEPGKCRICRPRRPRAGKG
jgi:hypothetical protein